MDLKAAARSIFSEAVKAADPYLGIKKFVERQGDDIHIAGELYPEARFSKVIVIGGGKASARMGQALEEILGDRISGGWINTKDGHAVPLKRITVHECGHPVPDERGIYGARRIIDLLDTADSETLVICLLSGGGSALMPAPAEGISLGEKQDVTRLLLAAGAAIDELNAVRKHLSIIKGGGMARLAAPAHLHVLILSDVIGDKLDTIASGPGVYDRTTFRDCIDICSRCGIFEKLPQPVRERFLRGAEGTIPETAKPGEGYLSLARNTLIGNNRMSVEAAEKAASGLGFGTLVLSTVLEGEAKEIGTVYAAIASEIVSSGNPLPMPACVIGGGETTVTVRGRGKGGRNQEMALRVAERISGLSGVAFLSGGTDGTDGPTDAAGGVVDSETRSIGTKKGLNIRSYLDDNDSYHYLQQVDGLLMTGPTGTNVMDVQILLAGKPDMIHRKFGMAAFAAVLFMVCGASVSFSAEKHAGDFLALGAGARALGMGSAFVAVTDGATSAYYNPAGLLHLKTREMNLMHSEQFGGLENYNTVAGGASLNDREAIGFTLLHIGVGDIKYTRLFDPSKALSDSNRPEIASQQDATDLALLLAGAQKLSPRLGIGATVKIVRRAVGNDTAFGYGIDLGAQYRLGNSLSLGVVFRDVTGTQVNWDGQLSNDRIAPTVDVGAAYYGAAPWIGGNYILASSIAYFGDSPRIKGINTMNLGLEYWLRDILAFRAGSSEGNGTFGIGLARLPLISSSSLDYAFLSHSELDSTHRLSMTIRF